MEGRKLSTRKKAASATRWSFLTEIAAKFISPITYIILARLLAPEAFGVVATITMVVAFVEIFCNFGLQKYFVQHQFDNKEILTYSANVAFTANFLLSLFTVCLIIACRDNLATIIGSSGYGNALAVISISLPIASFSSIQQSLLQKELLFKRIFKAKIIGILSPLFVTIPIAFILHSYWAIIIGTLSTYILNAFFLTLFSEWKPQFRIDVKLFVEMFKFGKWTLFEQFLGWANLYVGIFIVSQFFNLYYIGLYKTSMGVVNQLMAILVYSLSPIFLSTLSQLQDNRNEYNSFYCNSQKMNSMIIIPLGIGIYVYRNLVTSILLGNQWLEASDFIGLWGLMYAFSIAFGGFSIEALISIGKPQYASLTQILHLAILIPALVIAAHFSFTALYITRSLIRIQSIIVNLILLHFIANISVKSILKNNIIFLSAAMLMGVSGFFMLNLSNLIAWQLCSVVICIMIYFSILFCNKKTRMELVDKINSIYIKKSKDLNN